MLANIRRDQLFLASRIALIATGMTFAFRAALEGVWGTEFILTKEAVLTTIPDFSDVMISNLILKFVVHKQNIKKEALPTVF